MKILHLTTDEKFIDGAMQTFEEAFPNGNELLVLKWRNNSSIKFIRSAQVHKEVIFSQSIQYDLQQLAANVDWVVIHGMNEVWAEFILLHEKTLKILYIVWGAEFHSSRFIDTDKLLGPLTLRIKKDIEYKPVFERLKDVYRFFRHGKKFKSSDELIAKAFQKLRHIGLAYPHELELYKELGIVNDRVEYVKFGYYPMEYFMKGIDLSVTLGGGILIGNSSSLTNNHLEVFEKLHEINVDRDIVVPLNYGNPRLRKYLNTVGKEKFGKRYKPLVNFMSIEEYTKIMQGCSVVIMNHYRQQGMGNIISAIYLGSKVFMDSRNTFFKYLRHIGCYVYDIEVDLNSVDDLIPLSDVQIERNRTLLLKELSLDVFVKSLRRSL
jgi:hypothetical protein